MHTSTVSPRRPTARTFEGRQRQCIHALKRTLGYSESEYRTILYGITGYRHARDLDGAQLTHAVAVLPSSLSSVSARQRPRSRPTRSVMSVNRTS